MIIQIDRLNENDKLNLDFSEKFVVSEDFFLESNEVMANFKGDFSKGKDYFKLEGVLSFDLTIACSRCLAPVVESFEVDVLEFFKNENVHLEDVESDDNFIYFDTLEVDLTESLLINIQLHIPSTVLCDDDCEGLCQYCGINLNHTKCSCEKPIDPRFESLRSLLDNK